MQMTVMTKWHRLEEILAMQHERESERERDGVREREKERGKGKRREELKDYGNNP